MSLEIIEQKQEIQMKINLRIVFLEINTDLIICGVEILYFTTVEVKQQQPLQ